MNLLRTAPVLDRRPYSEASLERMAAEALRKHAGVVPERPGAVPIERLIEETFGFTEVYEELDRGVLGEIHFGIWDRPLRIRVARRLGEINPDDPSIDHERRITLAHEFGHAIAHCRLFARALRRDRAPLLPGFEKAVGHIACRDDDIQSSPIRPSGTNDELWLEWEANFLMAALLVPRRLVFILLNRWLTGTANGVTPRYLSGEHRDAAVAATAHTFNVTRELASSRIASLVSEERHPDLFGAF